MIRVCMIVHQDYYGDARVRRYAESLADAEVQVDVLCLRDRSQSPNEQRNGVRVFTIPLSRAYKHRASYLLEYGIAFLLFTVNLLRLYIRRRYQIIHVHNMPDFLVFTALIPRILGAKLILDIHDPMPEVYMSKYRERADARMVQLMRVQERFSARLADAVITANSNFKGNLVKRGMPADKITVVNNVADPKVFNRHAYHKKHSSKDQRFTLIYPGTIAPRYGLDIAIRALPLLVDSIPQLHLVIIGLKTKYSDELIALAKQLDVFSIVQFKPAISVDEVPRHIAQADVGIYSARWDPHMDIATPTKVLEYAAMGIPVIASRLKVLEDLFTDSSVMFFEPGNVEQFARCVLELFENPATRATLVRSMDENFVSLHSWSNEQQTYFKLLDHLLVPRASMGT